MKIRAVTVERYRAWAGPTTWHPGKNAALIGPNNGGKTTLLRAVDLVLNPHRNPYRDALVLHDFSRLDVSQPVEITIVLDGLGDEDCDVFEEYLEGQRADGSFGGFDDPHEEFDLADVVLRLTLRADVDQPWRTTFARPDAGGARVTQEHKIRIGWHLVPAGMDPLKELAFYQGSVFARLFERVDLSAELDQIRQGIEQARTGLMSNPHVADTRERLEEAALRLSVTEGAQPFDLHVLSMSDRRVLQSLEPVLRGRGISDRLPLRSHGGGALRILLLAAVLQQARLDRSNLILAVEEPEQNLEPINQRLVARRMLFDPTSSAAQVLVSTHSSAIVSTRPLDELHLVTADAGGSSVVRSLRAAAPADRKFFERHSRSALTDGLYAAAVVLLEGPTEAGGLPALWAGAFPDEGLDEHRIELIDCESITKMEPFARFYRAVGVPVVAICDCDPQHVSTRADIVAASAGLMVTWSTRVDWEGVLAAESDIPAITAAMDEILSEIGGWVQWEQQLKVTATGTRPDPGHVAGAGSLVDLVAGYPQKEQREVLAALLRAKQPSWKSARDQRRIAEALPSVPKTIEVAMLLAHEFARGNPDVRGEVGL